MEAIILCGIQATGKSTFCKEHFYATHMRLNLDMLKTRHREQLLLTACIQAKQPFVIDNTNPTREDRRRYIDAAKSAGFHTIGYYFESKISDALVRNAARQPTEFVSEPGIKGTAARFELPSLSEGFDALFHVRIGEAGFEVREWRDEV
jgi:predicted kinase